MLNKIINEVKLNSNKDFAEWFKPFINRKNSSDEIILGVRVPVLRKIAKKYSSDINLKDIETLLKDKHHEIRLLAIFIMLIKVKKEPEPICKIYLKNLKYINNWDLIDYTAPHIVAPNVGKDVLRKLAKEDYIWANRVAMVSTIYYIKQNDYELTFEFAEKFISNPNSIIHKAAGWMLREIGKRDEEALKIFLIKHKNIPAIMKSYATERLKHLKQLCI